MATQMVDERAANQGAGGQVHLKTSARWQAKGAVDFITLKVLCSAGITQFCRSSRQTTGQDPVS